MIQKIIATNESVTPTSREMKALHEYFPQCFDREDRFDIDKFREAIKNQVDVTREGRSYDFLGKSYARMLSSMETTTVLKPDKEHNALPENIHSENIYISGDNLDALHHLVKSYAGQVKCIYIDPPYNTGTDGFVYHDKFKFTAGELESKLSVDPDEAEKIIAMTSGHRASHSAWLTFMMPRLQLARDLLSKDGVIFISIDDNEQAYLKHICDFIFGEDNFVASFCKKGTGGRQDSAHFAKIHEYVLCYANSKFEAGETEKEGGKYPFTDKNGKNYNIQLLRKWGDAALKTDRPNMFFPIYYDGINLYLKPDGRAGETAIFPMIDDTTEGRWRWGVDTMEDALLKELVEIKNVNGHLIAYERLYEPDEDVAQTKLFSTWIDDVNNRTGKALLKELFDGFSPFEYPKPVDFIKKIIKMGNAMDGIVLDFFSGSATTAHAVMEMNVEDGDHRQFIMVQWPEACQEKSEAYKHGYRTIDEIGMERIKRAAQKIRKEHPTFTGDLGFKHYTLEEVPQNTLDKLEDFDPNAVIASEDILNLFGRDTVLTTWLVQDGYGLNAITQDIQLHHYRATLCQRHLYLTDPDFTEDDMVALVDRYQSDPSFNPDCLVLFGYSFSHNAMDMLVKNKPTIELIKDFKPIIDVRY